ncbi:unnamed protein product [Orchesella dallaii]|uniref:Translocon-associated protein subunit beta n=1 Tax=Orchesella dallaii TaxID=48710 RepID=A0ABP1PW44_9HEXA
MRSSIILIFIFSSFVAIVPIMGKLVTGRYKESFDNELETETKKSAQLLVRKQLRNNFVVEGVDLVVEYTIYNVGTIAATRVHLKDSSFEDENNFIGVSGFTDVTFGNIPAGGNASHIIVIRPVNPGVYNFTAAQITYSYGTGEQDTVGTSTEPGSVLIHSSVVFHRTYSPHYVR